MSSAITAQRILSLLALSGLSGEERGLLLVKTYEEVYLDNSVSLFTPNSVFASQFKLCSSLFIKS